MKDHNFIHRMMPFLVLEVLKNHTDEDHGLGVLGILELLEWDYHVKSNRKVVSRILNDLTALSEIPKHYDWKNPMPFSLKFDVIPRSTGDIRENWRLAREFEDGEIRLLQDLAVSVPGYPTARLLGKLQRQGSWALQPNRTQKGAVNRQMPMTLDCLEKAVAYSRKISFDYDGQARKISPYKTVFRDGNYYLLGCEEAPVCLEIQKIRNAVLTDEPARDRHGVSELAPWGYDVDAWFAAYSKTKKQTQ